MKYVQLSDDAKTVIGIFASPQDPSDKPWYAELDDTDPRWVSYQQALDVQLSNAPLQAQISSLECLETPRRVAEAVLGTEQQVTQPDGSKLGWLKDNRNKIAALRTQLKK